MKLFWRVLSAERIKLSKSHLWLLVLASPAFAVLIGALAKEPEGFTWEGLLSLMGMLHALLLLPILSGLFVALLCRYEHQNGGWKQLLSLPVTRGTVYLSKFVLAAGLLAAVQLVFLLCLLGMGWIRDAGPVPWELLFTRVLGGWIAVLPLAALQLAVSQGWSSFAAPLALNVSFTLPNILIANSATYGPYYPWVQPIIAMSPYSSGDAFGAFNLPLESLMVVVLGSFIIFFTAGLLFFRRKAV
ncbi:ABC transporter permease [Paenibacillus sp. sgz500958]|uniref:ABC transporter permease n=1 Tax=Paenibacillus sp. sgz500958 TaxID=3242475 RepID=UPI0036D28B28